MSATKAVFVLVHGAWHNHSTWDVMTPILEANGFSAVTLDLPGAGVNAIAPNSLGVHPFNPAAFATERSPVAGVTQDERTQAVVALVKEAASLSDGKVILVGHSAGRFGTVPRHYIRCTQDRAVPLTGQDHMIATVDSAIGSTTTTHTLESSHSPFLSQPAALAKILVDICVQSLAEQSAEAL